MKSYEEEKKIQKKDDGEDDNIGIVSLQLNDETKKELTGFKKDLTSFGGALFKDLFTGGKARYAAHFCEGKVKKINGEVPENYSDENLDTKNEPASPLIKLNLHAVSPKIHNALLSISQNKRKFVKLSFRSLTTNEAKTIASGLITNTALVSLNLSKNSLNSEGIVVLAEALKKNKYLKHLDLSWNYFDDVGLISLANMLKVNNTLTSIDISGNLFTEKGAAVLKECLSTNSTIRHMGLPFTFNKKSIQDILDKNTTQWNELVILNNEKMCPIFEPEKSLFNLKNAHSLAQLSKLSYGEKQQIENKMKQWAFKNVAIYDTDSLRAFIISDENNIIIAFRGTNNFDNVLTDLNIFRVEANDFKGTIHLGFKKALFSIWDQIKQKIYQFRNNAQNIWFTGHSLGGALATLATIYLISNDHNLKEVTHLYTFGSPRCGNLEFNENFESFIRGRCFRIIHYNDPITTLPPVTLGYKHIGNIIYLDGDGLLSGNYINRHKELFNTVVEDVIDFATDSAEGRSAAMIDATLSLGKTVVFLPFEVIKAHWNGPTNDLLGLILSSEDHYMKNYHEKISHLLEKSKDPIQKIFSNTIDNIVATDKLENRENSNCCIS